MGVDAVRSGGVSSFGYAGTIAHALTSFERVVNQPEVRYNVLNDKMRLRLVLRARCFPWRNKATRKEQHELMQALRASRRSLADSLLRSGTSLPHAVELMVVGAGVRGLVVGVPSRTAAQSSARQVIELCATHHDRSQASAPHQHTIRSPSHAPSHATANHFEHESSDDLVILEKSPAVGGVWHHYANSFSRVQNRLRATRISHRI
eukprot:2654946-Prymnesium_polylepis.1